MQARRRQVPAIVGLVLASLAFLAAVADAEISPARDWKLAALIVGVAFAIGWAGGNVAVWLFA